MLGVMCFSGSKQILKVEYTWTSNMAATWMIHHPKELLRATNIKMVQIMIFRMHKAITPIS